jgi:hypothetical protein
MSRGDGCSTVPPTEVAQTGACMGGGMVVMLGSRPDGRASARGLSVRGSAPTTEVLRAVVPKLGGDGEDIADCPVGQGVPRFLACHAALLSARAPTVARRVISQVAVLPPPEALPIPVEGSIMLSPTTPTGMVLALVVASPNCPEELSPQHITPPSVVRTHV